MVFYQAIDDPEHTVKCIQPHMRDTDIEASRAMQFSLHFFGNQARKMPLNKRVTYSVKCANDEVPYDIGDDKPAKKRARESSSAEPGSDSDGEKEDFNKRIKIKPIASKKGAGSSSYKRAPVSNLPRDKVPSVKKLPSGMTGVGGDGSAPAPDVSEKPTCALAWSETHSVFLPDSGSLFDIPSTLPSVLEKFCRSIDFVRDKVNVGHCQFFPAYAPTESWAGLHHHDGVCLINLAHRTEPGGIIGTAIHELAHEASSHHDIAHGREMQALFAHMVAQMVPF